MHDENCVEHCCINLFLLLDWIQKGGLPLTAFHVRIEVLVEIVIFLKMRVSAIPLDLRLLASPFTDSIPNFFME